MSQLLGLSRSTFTADVACIIRAHGALHRDPRLRNPDGLARRFAATRLRLALLPIVRQGLLPACERATPGIYFLHQARTRHFDAVAVSELSAGSRQLVILGAGFDSRAYRLTEHLRQVRVFEVDRPLPSAEKRRRVARALGALPANVTYVSVDFERSTPAQELELAGFDPALRTFFLAEGLSYYLHEHEFESLLGLVARAAPGSSVAFDYMTHEALQHPDTIARKHLAAVSQIGEPCMFGVDHADVDGLFRRCGLTTRAKLTSADLEERYLVGSDGRTWGRLPTFVGIAEGRAG